MKRMKKALAVLMAVGLLAGSSLSNVSLADVQAAEEKSTVYDQMRLESITIQDEGKDAIVVEDEGYHLTADLKIAVPEGWIVSYAYATWTQASPDQSGGYVYAEEAEKEFTADEQPDDGIYSLEINGNTYTREGIYYFDWLELEFKNVANNKTCEVYYSLENFDDDAPVFGTESNPIEFVGWNDKDDEFTFLYNGAADFEIVSVKNVDVSLPLLTGISLKSSDPLKRTSPLEVELSYKEEGSGMEFVYAVFYDEERGCVEEIRWEAEGDDEGKYAGEGTITMKSEASTEKKERGNYKCFSIFAADFAGNYVSYEMSDSGKTLIGYQYDEDLNATRLNEFKNISFHICDKHTYQTIITKATTKKNGSIKEQCKYCGYTKSKKTIYYPKTVSLSTTSYTYDGKVKKPSITVKDSNGKKIASSNYTVTWSSGRKNVGEYSVKIKFKGNYTGTVTKTFTIKPKATSLTSVTAGTKAFTAKWKKQGTQTSGYQISYATNSKFTSAKTVTINKSSTLSKTVSKLSTKKTYYVKVRTYKSVKVNGKTKKIYSDWSTAKKVTTK